MCLDVNTPDTRGRSPAHAAALNNHVGALLELSEASLRPPQSFALPLSSFGGGSIAVLNLDGRDVDGATPLHLAAAAGQLEAVEFLCSAGADLNTCDGAGQTCVWRAVVDGKVRINVTVKWLLAGGGSGLASWCGLRCRIFH